MTCIPFNHRPLWPLKHNVITRYSIIWKLYLSIGIVVFRDATLKILFLFLKNSRPRFYLKPLEPGILPFITRVTCKLRIYNHSCLIPHSFTQQDNPVELRTNYVQYEVVFHDLSPFKTAVGVHIIASWSSLRMRLWRYLWTMNDLSWYKRELRMILRFWITHFL